MSLPFKGYILHVTINGTTADFVCGGDLTIGIQGSWLLFYENYFAD
jgi:hypothetical protein